MNMGRGCVATHVFAGKLWWEAGGDLLRWGMLGSMDWQWYVVTS